MWVLDNRTPYAAERNWVRDNRGRHLWLVVVRATFDVDLAGAVTLAEEQPPPALAPEYAGEAGASSMRWDSDLAYVKPTTDVVAEACAYTRGGKAAGAVPVRLRVGTIDKALHVYGTRVFYRGFAGGLDRSSPEPFVKRPITYEWAYGGQDFGHPDPSRHRMDERNPVGLGFAVDEARLVNTAAPAIEYPGQDLGKAGPAGFGPIDPSWQPRRAYAGTYDAAWEQRQKPLLPVDYNDLFGCSAPADQRCPKYLLGGEAVELTGMTAEGLLRFALPKIYLTYCSHFGTRREEHRGRLVTVLLLPEQKQVSLVWQSALPVRSSDVDYLDRTVIDEKAYLT